jgi:hypothetical protein
MISLLLFFVSFITQGQASTLKEIKSCEICIIDSICTDDTIYFNVSISKYCLNPLNTYFSYYTDVNSKPRYYNTTINCTDCSMNISIDAVHAAWDYTLTLESPKPSKTCPTQHVAHCGGNMSHIIWYITANLSVLFALVGILFCCIRYCRKKQLELPVKPKKKKVEVPTINV